MSTDRDGLISRDETQVEGFFDRIIRPCAAELVGVALFVFVGTSAVYSSGSVVGIALAHGFAIALLVFSIGPISGAHLNPAVTLGILLSGAITPLKAIVYFLCQMIGGIIGASLTRGVLSVTNYKLIAGGAHDLPADVTVGQGLLCEIVLTSVLVTVVLLTAVDETTKTNMCPLAIGLAVVVDILAGAQISGASMNPARSFGPAVAVSTYISTWSYHWIYWVGPALGALLAAIWYRLFLAGPEKRFPRI